MTFWQWMICGEVGFGLLLFARGDDEMRRYLHQRRRGMDATTFWGGLIFGLLVFSLTGMLSLAVGVMALLAHLED